MVVQTGFSIHLCHICSNYKFNNLSLGHVCQIWPFKRLKNVKFQFPHCPIFSKNYSYFQILSTSFFWLTHLQRHIKEQSRWNNFGNKKSLFNHSIDCNQLPLQTRRSERWREIFFWTYRFLKFTKNFSKASPLSVIWKFLREHPKTVSLEFYQFISFNFSHRSQLNQSSKTQSFEWDHRHGFEAL